MSSNCSVFGCYNTRLKTKDSGVKYFRFPKDEELIKQWKNACRRADTINHKHAIICSVHFAADDYEDDMQSRLLNCEPAKNKRPLKNNAVPSLHLPKGVLMTSSSVAREGRVKKRNDRKSVDELCQLNNEDASGFVTSDVAAEAAIECLGNNADGSPISEVISIVIPEEIKRELQQLRDEVKILKEENFLLRKENTGLRENIVQIIKNVVLKRTESILSPLFSKTQINAIVTKEKVREWSNEDIASALTLRSLSPKCYKYLRVKKGFPLPCASTLKERSRKLSCEPGILASVVSLLSAKVDTFSQSERLAVLSIDEMCVSSEYCIDKGSDVLYGPHDKVTVVMLQGLVAKWKQPIYYDFDQSHVTKILLSVIMNVEAIGIAVVAVVSDMGSLNIRMWNELGIDPLKDEISFKNPAADRQIFVFADVPHLIKLIRNNLLDSGFYLENGEYVSDSSIREMINCSKSEYGLAYKVNEMHLCVSGQQRQRVRYAVQLLSKSCADALRYLGEKGLLQSENWRPTSGILYLINDWYDVMNSDQMLGDLQMRSGFGMHLEQQTNVLNKVIDCMSTMKVKSPKTRCLYKFQKGVILSSKSLIGLFHMVKDNFGVKYILTKRLNQDCLEHFFGCVRQMNGPYDHPNPVDFKYRMRTLLLGKNVEIMSEKTNTNEKFNNQDMLTNISANEIKKQAKERELALEVCLTSILFKDLAPDCENDLDFAAQDDMPIDDVNMKKTANTVIEEEALKYIGGYIVKKFSIKYPHLGNQETSDTSDKSWIEFKSRGHLHFPSKEFSLQLTKLREVFNSIHGQSLRVGKNCLKTLEKELGKAARDLGMEIPEDVLNFFAKISVFFRIRHLNSAIRFNKKLKNKSDRGQEKKKIKLNM